MDIADDESILSSDSPLQIAEHKKTAFRKKFSKGSPNKYQNEFERYYFDDFSFNKYTVYDRLSKQTSIVEKVNLVSISGGYDYRYSAINDETILSRQDTSKIALATNTQNIELIYQTVPLESANVYLKAKYINNSDAPILSGPVKIYMDSNFIGESYIDTISPNEASSFSLGIDENIKIIRREKSKREKSGIFGKNIVINFDVEIEIKNYKKKTVKIEVIDRILKTGQADDINVFNEKFSIEPNKKTMRGIIIWILELKPDEKKLITFNYSIKHPEDFQLILNNNFEAYEEGEE